MGTCYRLYFEQFGKHVCINICVKADFSVSCAVMSSERQ